MPSVPRRVLPAVLLPLFLLAACGGGVDRSSPDAVYDAAMRAVAKHDLAGLRALLTEAGRRRLDADLRDFQKRLVDPVQGRFILERAAERRERIDPTEIERARHGDLEDAWRFLLRADPRPVAPARRPTRLEPGGDRAVVEYEDPQGTLRAVRLLRTEEGWAVDELGL